MQSFTSRKSYNNDNTYRCNEKVAEKNRISLHCKQFVGGLAKYKSNIVVFDFTVNGK